MLLAHFPWVFGRYFGLALGLLLLLASQPAAHGQTITGQVLDQVTQKPLGFVSIGVLSHPYGTVANARGHFALDLPSSFDTDSIRISLIGYASCT